MSGIEIKTATLRINQLPINLMRTKTGTVVSAKNDKTIVVQVDTYEAHAKYKKRYRVSSKFHAHDPENQYKEGEKVTVYESRPLSKLKRWTVVKPDESAQ